MSTSISEIIKSKISYVIEYTVKFLNQESREETLGPNLSKFVKNGTGKTLLIFACYADCLRVVFNTLTADGDISEGKLKPCKEFLKSVSEMYSRFRSDYSAISILNNFDIESFLEKYKTDAGDFGYKDFETKWASISVLKRISIIHKDDLPLKFMQNLLSNCAEELLNIYQVKVTKKNMYLEGLKDELKHLCSEHSLKSKKLPYAILIPNDNSPNDNNEKVQNNILNISELLDKEYFVFLKKSPITLLKILIFISTLTILFFLVFLFTFKFPKPNKIFTLKGHKDVITNVCFSPDSKRIASSSFDKSVKIWDPYSGIEILNLSHVNDATTVCFSPDGKKIASGSYGFHGTVKDRRANPGGDHTYGIVKVWDAITGQELFTSIGHKSAVHDIYFSPDGRHIVSASDGTLNQNPSVVVWDSENGKEIKSHKVFSGRSLGIRFSPDGKHIVAKNVSRKLTTVLETSNFQEIITLPESIGQNRFDFSGKRIAGVNIDKSVKIWDSNKGQEVLTLKGYLGGITVLCFSSDGDLLATGSEDKIVRVWDAQTGKEIIKFKGHSEPIMCVCFSPNGELLASGSVDKTVKVWVSP